MRTEGCYVYDVRGRRYIDFLSGWCVGNFGWDNTAVTKSPVRRRPDYRATGGSEAVDIALQIAC